MGNCNSNSKNRIIKRNSFRNINDIKHIINSITFNKEYDLTKELEIDALDIFVDSIFPCNFSKSIINEIKNQIYKIKDTKINESDRIQHLYILQNLDVQNYFYIIIFAKKITKKTITIAYKLMIENNKKNIYFDILFTSNKSKIDIKNCSNEEINEIKKLLNVNINTLKKILFFK